MPSTAGSPFQHAGSVTRLLLAWRAGDDTPALRSLGSPGGSELVPVVLVVLGLALATWVGTAAFAASGRRYGR